MKQTKSFHSLQPKESVIETPAGVVETDGAESRQAKSPSKAAERKSESKQSDPSRATTAPSVMNRRDYNLSVFYKENRELKPRVFKNSAFLDPAFTRQHSDNDFEKAHCMRKIVSRFKINI